VHMHLHWRMHVHGHGLVHAQQLRGLATASLPYRVNVRAAGLVAGAGFAGAAACIALVTIMHQGHCQLNARPSPPPPPSVTPTHKHRHASAPSRTGGNGRACKACKAYDHMLRVYLHGGMGCTICQRWLRSGWSHISRPDRPAGTSWSSSPPASGVRRQSKESRHDQINRILIPFQPEQSSSLSPATARRKHRGPYVRSRGVLKRGESRQVGITSHN
jgi:hypothetical protein